MFAGIGAGAAALIIIILVVVVIVRSRRHNAAPAVKPANSGSHMSDEFMYMNPAYGAPVLGNQQHGSGISQAHVGSGGAGANDRIPYYASSSHAAASSANGTAGHYTTPTAAAAGGARDYMTPQSAYETPVGGYATLSPDHARYATSGYAEARADGSGESGDGYEVPRGGSRAGQRGRGRANGGSGDDGGHYEVVDEKHKRRRDRAYLQPAVQNTSGHGSAHVNSTYADANGVMAAEAGLHDVYGGAMGNSSISGGGSSRSGSGRKSAQAEGMYIDASALAQDEPVMLYATHGSTNAAVAGDYANEEEV